MYNCFGGMAAYGPGWFTTVLLVAAAVALTWWLTSRGERRPAEGAS